MNAQAMGSVPDLKRNTLHTLSCLWWEPKPRYNRVLKNVIMDLQAYFLYSKTEKSRKKNKFIV